LWQNHERLGSSQWEESGDSQLGATRTNGSDLAAAISLSLMQRPRQYTRGAAECSSGLCLAALRADESEWETEPQSSVQNCIAYEPMFTIIYLDVSSSPYGPRRQTEHLFPSCIELKNGWSCTSPFRTRLHCVYRNSLSYATVTLLKIRCAQSVETLHYKPEGRGFDSRRCHRNFSFT